MARHPLTFKVLHECKITKARTSLMVLPHHEVETPVFMPVGTQVIIIFSFQFARNHAYEFLIIIFLTGYFERSHSRTIRTTELSNHVRQYIPSRDQTGNGIRVHGRTCIFTPLF